MKRFFCLILILSVLLGLCACGTGAETTAAPDPKPLRVAVVSDIHYTGAAYAYAGSFRAANDLSGTGKQVELLPFLFDAFVAQMLREKPDVLLLTGDNSFNGARVSHEELIEKLAPLRQAGIVLLTLPGNHDLGAPALIFPDGEAEQAGTVGAEDFAALYADFGYDAACARDGSSLSYVYDTGRGVRVFMLDTCFRYGVVYGRLGEDTLSWLDAQLRACREAGDTALVAGHHNALVHNPLFAFNYTLDDGEELRALLEQYGVTLYLSGHLHPQNITREGALTDVATESFAVWPHRYGIVELCGTSWRYTAHGTDVESLAAETKSSDERLLRYSDWGREWFLSAARAQAEGNFAGVEDADVRALLCEHFAAANVGYFAGTPIPAPEGELAALIEGLSGRAGQYLRSITGIPDSLAAEGDFG